MNLSLDPNIHAAACGDDLVLLDLASGGYSCLAGCAGLARLSAGSSAVELLDEDLARELGRLGLVRSGEAEPRLAAQTPVRELRASAAARVRPRHLLALAGALAWMAGAYWRAPFAKMVGKVQSRALGECGEPLRIIELALVLRQMLPWIPFQGVCLYRSVLLLAFLRAQGLSASWIFAVQTYPFKAHCWLQAGDLVLDDDVEHVLGLVPILALAP